MHAFRLTIRSQRVVEEIFYIIAKDRGAAIEAYHDGEGELIDESIIDQTDGPIVQGIEDCGEYQELRLPASVIV